LDYELPSDHHHIRGGNSLLHLATYTNHSSALYYLSLLAPSLFSHRNEYEEDVLCLAIKTRHVTPTTIATLLSLFPPSLMVEEDVAFAVAYRAQQVGWWYYY